MGINHCKYSIENSEEKLEKNGDCKLQSIQYIFLNCASYSYIKWNYIKYNLFIENVIIWNVTYIKCNLYEM